MTDSIQNISKTVVNNLSESIQFAFRSRKSTIGVLSISSVTFLLFVLLTFPRYSLQMMTAGVMYWSTMIQSLLWLIIESSGVLGLSLLIIYASVTGILSIVVLGNIRYQSQGTSGLLSIVPAVVFSGCASCGAGLLGVLGAFGYASLFPFEGNFVRFLGILLVIGVLVWVGDPRKCSI